MKIHLLQEIIDVLRFKKLSKNLSKNTAFLSFLMNILSIFEYNSRETKIKNMLLRFAGASIGKNVHIGYDVKIYNCQNLEIEDNVIINDCNKFYCWHKINIQKNSFTSVNVVFVAGSHNTEDYEDLLENQSIVIEKGCWIGANSTIIGGAILQDGCIVGANSILLEKIYPSFSIIAGNPAKIIKKRNYAEIIKQPIIYNIKEIIR